jgi:hypothetical protein
MNTSIQDSNITPTREPAVDKTKVILEKPANSNPADCYWQILKRDTLVASISQKGNLVSGKLSFDNFEKDGSSGNVSGKSENGILKLWYSFESEGMKSVMEVWLKKQGNVLIRGTGEMNTRSDTAYFTNPAAVEFAGSQQMKKVDCAEVPAKYKL